MLTVILITVLLQILGFLLVYMLLKRRLDRFTTGPDETVEKVREELNSIMVEINRTTEQNIGIIEDRVSQLSDLIVKADKKLSLLQREDTKRNSSERVLKQIRSEQPPRENNVHDRVLRLYREGFSPEVIAGHIGTTVGEVELIISLKERKR